MPIIYESINLEASVKRENIFLGYGKVEKELKQTGVSWVKHNSQLTWAEIPSNPCLPYRTKMHSLEYVCLWFFCRQISDMKCNN